MHCYSGSSRLSRRVSSTLQTCDHAMLSSRTIKISNQALCAILHGPKSSSVRILTTSSSSRESQAQALSFQPFNIDNGRETQLLASGWIPGAGQSRSRAAFTATSATSASSAGGASEVPEGNMNGPEIGSSFSAFMSAFYQFTRPHTMIGTTISILSISLLALHGVMPTAAILPGLGQALSAALLMNISIVGVNQLCDIEIDKVNKPYLPLASGAFSVATGNAIVIVCTAVSLLIGWTSGSPALMATLVISCLLGLAYSTDVPFMRWKRSPVLAAGCILTIRALAVQLGFYWHMRYVLGGANALGAATWEGLTASAAVLPVPVVFTCTFMLLFSIVIALFKDIPDAKGDKMAGLQTLTVRLGTAVPFWTCIWTLTLAYVGACGYSVVMASLGDAAGGMAVPSVAAAMAGGGGPAAWAMPASLSIGAPLPFKALVSILGHATMGTLLWWRALKVDLNSKKDITDCYMHVWKLFYAEYMLIPFFA